MYLWVVLTTFLAMIAAYYLPLRADTADKEDIGVARAQLIQMVAQHKAAAEYMLLNSWPHWCDGGMSNCENNVNNRRKANFQTGYFGADVLAGEGANNHMPKGFIYNNNFSTKLYCMKYNIDTHTYTASDGAGGCDRSEDDIHTATARFLLTSGPIPERWKSYSPETGQVRPSPDMMAAMREQFTKKEVAGYAYIEDGQLKVVNFEHSTVPMPTPIVSDDTADNSSASLKDCVDREGACLVYMTPR